MISNGSSKGLYVGISGIGLKGDCHGVVVGRGNGIHGCDLCAAHRDVRTADTHITTSEYRERVGCFIICGDLYGECSSSPVSFIIGECDTGVDCGSGSIFSIA